MGALAALGQRPELDVCAYAVTWRRRHLLAGELPTGVTNIGRRMPARPLNRAWVRWATPPLEWWTGHVDLVHGTNFVVPPTARAARIVTVHDLTTVHHPELCHPSTLPFPTLIRKAVEAGAWVHVPSRFVAEEVIDVLGVARDRVRPVHHGVPTVDGAPPLAAPASCLPPEVDRYVLALGTVEPRKDLPALVRAFDAIAGRRADVSLVVAGPDGWGVDAFDDAAAAAAHRQRIVRLGYVRDSHRDELLRRAAVFAYPSIYEGFGFPPLEAMAVGVPVVATMAGALPEVLGDGAALVPVGDTDALGEMLARLLDDDEERAALIERGRRRVASYTWDACAAGLSGLYHDALS